MNEMARQAVRLLAVLTTAALLASCATHDLGTTRDFPDKVVQVSVQSGAIQPISLVGVPASQPGVIKWVFASSSTGYIFPDSSTSAPGIVFKIASAPPGCAATPDPGTVFHNCGSKANGTRYQCNVKQGNAGNCFAYTVTVVPATGSIAPAVPSLDPWVRQE